MKLEKAFIVKVLEKAFIIKVREETGAEEKALYVVDEKLANISSIDNW